MMGQRQNIDKAQAGQAQEQLDEQDSSEAYEGPLAPQKVAEFHAVTSAMQAIFAGMPVETVARNLPPEQQAALESLYTAKAARDPETGLFVSGLERKQDLEQALMCLQPILALGLRPDFRAARPIYADLVARVGGVRKEISSAIRAQIMGRKRRKKVVDEAQDGAGDDERDDDLDDGDAADEAPDQSVEAVEAVEAAGTPEKGAD